MSEVEQPSPDEKVIKYSNGEYVGEIEMGVRHGVGKIMYDDARYYSGQWKNDIRHGQGTEKYSNGDS